VIFADRNERSDQKKKRFPYWTTVFQRLEQIYISLSESLKITKPGQTHKLSVVRVALFHGCQYNWHGAQQILTVWFGRRVVFKKHITGSSLYRAGSGERAGSYKQLFVYLLTSTHAISRLESGVFQAYTMNTIQLLFFTSLYVLLCTH